MKQIKRMNSNQKQNIKCTIMYDGSRYKGWQRLGGDNKQFSIQGILEEKISILLKQPIKIIGASRTDANVHALRQSANFYLKDAISLNELKERWNALLPEDIRVIELKNVNNEFNSRYDAKRKTYEYHIDTREKANVFSKSYSLHYPKKLDVKMMRMAGKQLVGTHDFRGFSSQMRDGRSTIRTIYSIDIIEKKEDIIIRIVGDGFLYNMIRIIVGTLLEIGEGSRKESTIEDVFLSKNREFAGKTVDGKGLFLCNIDY